MEIDLWYTSIAWTIEDLDTAASNTGRWMVGTSIYCRHGNFRHDSMMVPNDGTHASSRISR